MGKDKPGEDRLQSLIRAHFRTSKPYQYVSGLEALSDQAGLPPEKIIKLDGNENPYGCSPRVRQALSEHDFYHVYPDTEQRDLRRGLEAYTGITASRLMAGAGSDELIELVLRLFIDPGDAVVNCVPTFGMYSFTTENAAGRLVAVAREPDFSIDAAKVLKAVEDSEAKLVFIASPNNPTGNTTPRDVIEDILQSRAVVVVDEAYFEFSGETVIDLTATYDNLIVLRTFSKWAGLAGLRIGYGVFPQAITDQLWRIKTPYTVSKAAQVAALVSIEDRQYLLGTVRLLIEERQRLFEGLAGIGGFKPFPSRANFILCQVTGGRARHIKEELARRGISIRYFDTPQLRDYVRISVGKPEHTAALIAALEQIC